MDKRYTAERASGNTKQIVKKGDILGVRQDRSQEYFLVIEIGRNSVKGRYISKLGQKGNYYLFSKSDPSFEMLPILPEYQVMNEIREASKEHVEQIIHTLEHEISFIRE